MNIDDIWADDLLDRRTEAQFLQQFLVRTYKHTAMVRTGEAYTIAIDASYGEGKSFFLRRLRKQLSINHAVAFIDAWADDTSDQPYTALTCALEDALDPYLDKPGPISQAWSTVKNQSRSIARIASLGALKRGVGLLITQKGADELGAVLGGNGDERKADSEAVGDVIDRLSDVFAQKEADAFRERRESVLAFKASLNQLIHRLRDSKIEINPPVFVIVDELDRCRPTYAVKLLEEVKTLFDVPGLVFAFGTHGDALQHSVKALYGQSFDAQAYLRRFFRRRYALKRPGMDNLIAEWLNGTTIAQAEIVLPPSLIEGRDVPTPFSRYLAQMFRSQQVSPREGDAVLDLLENFAIMWAGRGPIHAGFLVPLAINWVMGRLVTDDFSGLGTAKFVDVRTATEFDSAELFRAFLSAHAKPIQSFTGIQPSSKVGADRYVTAEMQREIDRRKLEPTRFAALPLHSEYISLVADLGRLQPGEEIISQETEPED